MLNNDQLSTVIEIIVREIRAGEFGLSAFRDEDLMQSCIEEVLSPLTEQDKASIGKLIKGAQAGVLASNSFFDLGYERAVNEAIALHTESTGQEWHTT